MLRLPSCAALPKCHLLLALATLAVLAGGAVVIRAVTTPAATRIGNGC
jgi:hypothetical protein